MRRLALAAVLCAPAGCGKGEPAPGGGPPPAVARDAGEFKKELWRTVPVRFGEFRDKGFRAASYERDPANPVFLRSAVVEFPRVYLADPLTGAGGWYTRARLSRREGKTGGGDWEEIELLP